MKKLASIALSLSLLFTFSVSSLAAEQPSLNQNELKQVHQQIAESIKQGKTDYSNFALVKKYRDLFKKYPQLEQEYLKSLDSLNKQKVAAKLKGVKVQDGETKVIQMDDGSSIILSSKTQIVPSSYSSDITPMNTGSFGTQYRHVATFEDPNVIANDILEVNTYYTTASNGITITSTNTSGSTAYWPDTIASQSSGVGYPSSATQTGQTCYSYGNFQVNTGLISGVPAYSTTFADQTEITWNSMDLYNDYYTVTDYWN